MSKSPFIIHKSYDILILLYGYSNAGASFGGGAGCTFAPTFLKNAFFGLPAINISADIPKCYNIHKLYIFYIFSVFKKKKITIGTNVFYFQK